ncbi:MAG: two-component system response regulator GlrR [Granulosicoccus sp.]|jgi:two-component system response regulator GlrR
MTAPIILLVDDDEALLTLMSIRLRRHNFEVTTATSGKAALAKLHKQLPHVMVTDLQMDGMDGMGLYDQVKSRYPLLPVIMLTAHGTIPDAVSATKEGIFAFLTKPFDGDTLVNYIQDAVTINIGALAENKNKEAWREDIITRSDVMEKLLADAKMVAQSDASVLIQCDSGTGKELLTKAIHKASLRSEAEFVGVNCTAIPDTLFESEFFGHIKGAFTGASTSRKGLFEMANGGTLFLDEIGDMSLEFQAKLLRALEEREIRPVGSNQVIPIDVRVICATHQQLDKAVAAGSFREDLYYRLHVVSLEIPPLKQRREDIPLLVNYFLQKNVTKDEAKSRFTPEAMRTLMSAPWPGNVRQLRNVVEQCVVLCRSPLISDSFVERALRHNTGEKVIPFAQARDEFEYDYLVDLLKKTGGKITQAAKLAGRNRSEFYKLLNKHNLEAAEFRLLMSE